jgi:quercetin dioxygenase-like cupin family protein
MDKGLFRLAALVLLIGIPHFASGTPPSAAGSKYLNYTLVIDPDATERVQINLPAAVAYEEDAPVRLGTRSPSVFVFQDFTLLPGGNTGWHIHPGIVLITMAEGSVDWYDAQCMKHVHSAGDFFMESDQLHFVQNNTSSPSRMIITFVIAKGLTNKIYRPAPACADALGLTRAY